MLIADQPPSPQPRFEPHYTYCIRDEVGFRIPGTSRTATGTVFKAETAPHLVTLDDEAILQWCDDDKDPFVTYYGIAVRSTDGTLKIWSGIHSDDILGIDTQQ
jgi:hypothetical protein